MSLNNIKFLIMYRKRNSFFVWYNIRLSLSPQGSAVAKVARRQPLISQARVRCLASPCEFCSRQKANGPHLYSSASALPVSIIPPSTHTHLHLNISFTRRTSGLSLETFKQGGAVLNIGGGGDAEQKNTFTLCHHL